MTNHWAVVPAAGQGKRIGNELPKQYIQVDGMCILDYSIQVLLSCEVINRVIVPLDDDDTYWQTTQSASDHRVQACAGGEHRFLSVKNALDMLSDDAEDNDWVVVHDGVRPCLQIDELHYLLRTIKDEPAGGVAVMPISDAIKRLDGVYVQQSLNRDELARAVTPQIFRYAVLCEAYHNACQKGSLPIDEAAAVEQIGKPIKTVMLSTRNIKLTYPEDLLCIKALLKHPHYPTGND